MRAIHGPTGSESQDVKTGTVSSDEGNVTSISQMAANEPDSVVLDQ